MSRLEAIRQREQAATRGPWRAILGEVYPDDGKGFVWPLPGSEADADFIAHARTDVPLLLVAVRSAIAALGPEVVDEYGDCHWCGRRVGGPPRDDVGHESGCEWLEFQAALAALLEPVDE